MDLGNIVYIVAVLGYFIYQATKKKQKTLAENEEEELPKEPGEKHTSFEDLLQEIRDAQKPRTPAPPKPVAVKPYVVQEDREEWRPDPVVQKRFPTKRRMEMLDDGEIENYQGEFEKVESELSKTSKGIPDIPTLKSVEETHFQKSDNRYRRMLKNPETIKDAIVFKEILDTKYF